MEGICPSPPPPPTLPSHKHEINPLIGNEVKRNMQQNHTSESYLIIIQKMTHMWLIRCQHISLLFSYRSSYLRMNKKQHIYTLQTLKVSHTALYRLVQCKGKGLRLKHSRVFS